MQSTKKVKQGRWILTVYELKDSGVFLDVLFRLSAAIKIRQERLTNQLFK
ncbi:MAG: hypothetical protein ACUBOA_08480 [Candidatus Loosdrechtia sp.]|nr:MAG: hypothetical protein QY305_08740 [Candidatus Jettenia sp. AMX2]